MPSAVRRLFNLGKKKNQGPKFQDFHAYDDLRNSTYPFSPNHQLHHHHHNQHQQLPPPPHSFGQIYSQQQQHQQHQQVVQQQIFPQQCQCHQCSFAQQASQVQLLPVAQQPPIQLDQVYQQEIPQQAQHAHHHHHQQLQPQPQPQPQVQPQQHHLQSPQLYQYIANSPQQIPPFSPSTVPATPVSQFRCVCHHCPCQQQQQQQQQQQHHQQQQIHQQQQLQHQQQQQHIQQQQQLQQQKLIQQQQQQQILIHSQTQAQTQAQVQSQSQSQTPTHIPAQSPTILPQESNEFSRYANMQSVRSCPPQQTQEALYCNQKPELPAYRPPPDYTTFVSSLASQHMTCHSESSYANVRANIGSGYTS